MEQSPRRLYSRCCCRCRECFLCVPFGELLIQFLVLLLLVMRWNTFFHPLSSPPSAPATSYSFLKRMTTLPTTTNTCPTSPHRHTLTRNARHREKDPSVLFAFNASFFGIPPAHLFIHSAAKAGEQQKTNRHNNYISTPCQGNK